MTINQALLKAVEAHKSGDVAAAKRLLSKIIQIEPNQPDANSNMGAILVASGDLEEALPFIKTALEANFSVAQHWFNYIDVLFKLDRFSEALELLAVARDKGCKGQAFDELEEKLGSTEVELKNRIQRLQDADWSGPKGHLLPFGLGEALQELGELEQAIEAYKKALSIKPDYADAHNNMGMALYDQGSFDEAANNYQKAVNLEPDFADAHYNLGNVLKKTGNMKQAIESYKASLAINPNDAEVLLNYGNALKDYGNFGQAIEAYVEAIKIKPDYTEPYSNMGDSLKEKGELDAAINCYKQAIKIKPDHAEVFLKMGCAFKEKGNLDAAIDSFKQAVKSKPGVRTLRSTNCLDTLLQKMFFAHEANLFFVADEYAVAIWNLFFCAHGANTDPADQAILEALVSLFLKNSNEKSAIIVQSELEHIKKQRGTVLLSRELQSVTAVCPENIRTAIRDLKISGGSFEERTKLYGDDFDYNKYCENFDERFKNSMLDYIKISPKKSSEVLDIGAGMGFLHYIFSYNNHKVCSFDIGDCADLFNKSCKVLGVQKEDFTIKKYASLLRFGKKFDIINASLICFNNHKQADLWLRDEWLYFLKDIHDNQLRDKGTLYLGFNRENLSNRFLGNDDLHDLFDPFIMLHYPTTARLSKEDIGKLV